MASPSNLLGLVSQLQNLEHSLTGLLMEMVVRISSLTDTKAFLLMETQEGRKICGHRQLCQQYLQGSLAPVASDFLFDVDASISSLRPVASFERGVENGGGLCGGGSNLNIGDINDGIGVNAIDAGINGGVNGITGNDALAYRNHSFSSRKRKHPKSSTQPLNQRPIPLNQRQETQQLPPASPANADSDVIVVKAEDDDSNWDEVIRMTEVVPTDDPDLNGIPFEVNALVPTGNREASNQISRSSAEESVNGHREHDLNEENYVEAVETKLSVDKLEVVKTINTENACMKGNVEYKLVTSLCYDFGKALAETKSFIHVDNARRKTFHDAHFDKWIAQFGSLTPFFQTRCHNGRPEGGQTCTFLGLIRHVSRKAFLQRISRDEKMKETLKTMPVAALQYK